MRLPQKLSDTGYQSTLINQIIDYLRSITPHSSATVRVRTSSVGTLYETNQTPGQSKPISGNWNYRGMYDPATASAYMTYDVVQFGSGTSAGMYLSTIDNNNNSPDSGIGWVQVSTGSGSWL